MQRLAQLCLALIFVWITGCGSDNSKKGPPKTQVKGTVLLDGKPMSEGEILFGVTGEPGISIPISNGSFSGEAVEGKNRVEISSFKDGPATTSPPPKINTIPRRYNYDSTLKADVTPGAANEFKFEIKSK